jgi:hypothetical protein
MTRAGPCVIIDVRTSEEFSRGHLEGAENIDWDPQTGRFLTSCTQERSPGKKGNGIHAGERVLRHYQYIRRV